MSGAVTRPTSMLAGPTGSLEYLSMGSGEPSTIFGHGLAGSISTTRPFATGVPGRRTFLHFRGHGASEAPESAWTYEALGEELRAVADHVGATQALGVSMGAGAMCSLLARTPDRFDRMVFVIPALIDRPRTDAALQRLVDLADLVEERDLEGIAAYFFSEQPEEVRNTSGVQAYAQEQARLLAGTPVARALRALPRDVPLADRTALQAVAGTALVIGQEGDAAHPAHIARELAEALPQAELEILPPGGVLWSHRSRVRELVADFLGTAHV